MPETLDGIGVSPGIGTGPVAAIGAAIPEPPVGDRHAGDVDEEKTAATAALHAVAGDLEERAAATVSADAREVLGAQALMARDPELADLVAARIDAGTSAARAVHEGFGVYRDLLSGAGAYVAGRVADLDDLRDRALARLLGLVMPGIPDSDVPFVLVARDLAPADTALLDPARVVAFVTEEGGPTSHTAILARSLGVPAVVACVGCTAIADGTIMLVDGGTGRLLIDPTEQELAAAREKVANPAAEVSGPGRTSDGHPVPLLANIGGPRDLEAALAHGAEGVGLYRTEFLFLDCDTAPSEDEQQAAYRAALEAFPGGRVVVRALDAGADKPLAFLPAPGTEPNPALGERGLRMLRRHPEILAGQLRALARAAAGTSATLQVMAPMVADVEDARYFTAACREAGIDAAGVMVEIPAAALRARDLVEATDFLSLGTNDLAQYTFAADRQIGALGRLQDAWQPALLDLVALTAQAARAADKGCGVCGEAAADPALACVFVGLGVTSLSMSAPSLSAVRAVLAAHTLDQCEQAADAASRAVDAASARRAAATCLPHL